MHLDHDHIGAHTHEHTHADGTTHSHEHQHPHDHTHGDCAAHTHEHTHADGTTHTHEHQHPHDHTHDCSHACAGCGESCEHTPMEELTALMKYMVGHNTAHAKELADLAAKLDQAGNHVAFEQVMSAVSDFEKGNMRLSVVLSSLTEG